MILIPIRLQGETLYVEWEEFRRNRDMYNQLQLKSTGKIYTKDVP